MQTSARRPPCGHLRRPAHGFGGMLVLFALPGEHHAKARCACCTGAWFSPHGGRLPWRVGLAGGSVHNPHWVSCLVWTAAAMVLRHWEKQKLLCLAPRRLPPRVHKHQAHGVEHGQGCQIVVPPRVVTARSPGQGEKRVRRAAVCPGPPATTPWRVEHAPVCAGGRGAINTRGLAPERQ